MLTVLFRGNAVVKEKVKCKTEKMSHPILWDTSLVIQCIPKTRPLSNQMSRKSR